MFLLEWTETGLLIGSLILAALIGLFVWLVPSAHVPRRRVFGEAEIRAYDRQIPG